MADKKARKKALTLAEHAKRARKAMTRDRTGLPQRKVEANDEEGGEGRTAMLQLRMLHEERDAVHAQARRRGMTASAYVRALINADLLGKVSWSSRELRGAMVGGAS